MKKALSAAEYKEIYMEQWDEDKTPLVGESWDSPLHKKLFSKEYEEKIMSIKYASLLSPERWRQDFGYDYDLTRANISINVIEGLSYIEEERREELKQKYQDLIDEITMRQALE